MANHGEFARPGNWLVYDFRLFLDHDGCLLDNLMNLDPSGCIVAVDKRINHVCELHLAILQAKLGSGTILVTDLQVIAKPHSGLSATWLPLQAHGWRNG
jgi:hypothetical protein